MHNRMLAALTGLAVVLFAATASAGEVKITIRDGRVTLMATNATVREILTEWSRVGGTAIVNADRLPGAPITIQLQDVSETQALESLLRSSNGYILASREAPSASASSVERIFVYPIAPKELPSTSSTVPVPRPMGQGPGFGRGRMQPGVNQPGGDDPDDESLVGAPRMGGRGAAGGSAVGRPPETTFDYANPMQIRQALEQAGSESGNVMSSTGAGGGSAVNPSVTVNPYGSTFVNPYTGQPVVTQTPSNTSSSTPGAATSSASRPGMVVTPPTQQQQSNPQNPYGLPTGVRPGSVVGPPVEPDRSKYTNPPRPPDTNTTTTGGGRGGR